MADDLETDAQQRGINADWRGAIAQDQVALLLTRAKLTANQPTKDREGWDIFVQFPSSLDVRPFLDQVPWSASCLVQVKAFQGHESSVRLTLANASKLAKCPLPTFIVAALIPDDHITELWVIHCGADFIERTLARLVKAEAGAEPSLNKIHIEVSLQDGTRILPEPDFLRAALLRDIGDDSGRYFARKQRWLATVGYGKGTKVFRVKFPKDDDAKLLEMAEFAVGLRDSIDADQVAIGDLRFGIERHERRFSDVQISLPNLPPGPRYAVHVERGSELAVLRCTGRFARHVFPFLPEEYNLLVLKNQYLTLKCRKVGIEYAVSMSLAFPDGGFTFGELKELAVACQAMRIAHLGCSVLRVEAENGVSATIGVRDAQSQELDPHLQAVENLAVIAPLLDLELNTVIDWGNLMRQCDTLHLIAATQRVPGADATVALPRVGLRDSPNLGDSCAFLFLTGLDLGDRTMVCVVATVGRLAQVADDSNRVEVTSPTVRLLVRQNHRHPVTVDRKSLFDEAESILANEGVQHVYRPVDTADSGDKKRDEAQQT